MTNENDASMNSTPELITGAQLDPTMNLSDLLKSSKHAENAKPETKEVVPVEQDKPEGVVSFDTPPVDNSRGLVISNAELAAGAADKVLMANGQKEREAAFNSASSELDGMIDTTGIMVIAATNLDELLDPALTRSGRFDKKIVFDLPTYDERTELFKIYISKIMMDINFKHETDIKLLAQRTARLTGADIKNICNQGSRNYMKRQTIIEDENKLLRLENTNTGDGCTLKDLNDAFDDIAIGNIKTENKKEA
jgi:SpoVK/Ycf46/Vps4 family AAA+-type ATPase